MRIIYFCVLIFLFPIYTQAVGSEVLTITQNKLHILKLSQSGVTAIIGNPTLVDITVQNPKVIFLFGKIVGETNLIVLNNNGSEIVNYDLIVTPELARHVTINRGVYTSSIMSCGYRCETIIETSSEAPKTAAKSPSPQSGTTVPAATINPSTAPQAPQAPQQAQPASQPLLSGY